MAALSLAALGAAILLSCVTRLNVGFLSIVLAWLLGAASGRTPAQVAAGFPTELFLTLVGVTLLFTQAQVNGTLDLLAHHAVRGCRGNPGLVPLMFFFIALGLSTMGPGAIAATALVAPMAMPAGERVKAPAFLMALMVGNGANAGNLSPFSSTGVIVNTLMARIGLTGFEWRTFRNNLLAHTAVALAAYFVFGGWRLLARGRAGAEIPHDAPPFERRHLATMAVIAALIVAVVFFRVSVGMGALAGAVLLGILCVADEGETVRRMPWGVILMVCGVTVLIALMEKTGGMDVFTGLLARLATPQSVTGAIAFITGLTSTFSSTSGVVLPAFLPTVPGLVRQLGGGDPLSIAFSVNIGSALVDVSPLSTIGALCIASTSHVVDRHRLFKQLLAWGLSMSLAGAAMCYTFLG